MIEERAIILMLESQAENESTATIEVVRKVACGLCGQTRGCGNSIWGKLFSHKATSFKAQNRINAKVGESVIVGIDESAVMKSALLLYMVPLATMMTGALLIAQLSNSDLVAMLGAAIGLVVGYFWVKGHTSGRIYYQSHQPTILRLADDQIETHSVKFQ